MTRTKVGTGRVGDFQPGPFVWADNRNVGAGCRVSGVGCRVKGKGERAVWDQLPAAALTPDTQNSTPKTQPAARNLRVTALVKEALREFSTGRQGSQNFNDLLILVHLKLELRGVFN